MTTAELATPFNISLQLIALWQQSYIGKSENLSQNPEKFQNGTTKACIRADSCAFRILCRATKVADTDGY